MIYSLAVVNAISFAYPTGHKSYAAAVLLEAFRDEAKPDKLSRLIN